MTENKRAKKITALMGVLSIAVTGVFLTESGTLAVTTPVNSGIDSGASPVGDMVEAEASYVYGSGNNRGGGGGGGGGFGWHTVGTTSNKTAFQRLFEDGYRGHWGRTQQAHMRFLRNFHNMTTSEINICRQSNYIWYFGNGRGAHMAGTGGNSGRWNPLSAGSRQYGISRGNVNTQWQEFRSYEGFGSIWGGTTTIICPAPGENPWADSYETEIRRETQTRTRGDSNERTFSSVAMKQVDIAPGIGFSGRFGEHTLHNQTSVEYTPFGELWQEIRRGEHNNTSRSSLIRQIERAIERTESSGSSTSSPWLMLSQQNQNAFAEGGVLNVTERERRAQIRLPSTSTTERRVGTYEVRTYSDGTVERDRTNWGNWESVSTSNPNPRGNNVQSFRNPSFFQMISVTCNPEQFESIVAGKRGVEIIESNRNDSEYSAVAYSRSRNSIPSAPDFGRGSGNATNNINFYTKECPLQCVDNGDSHVVDGSDQGSFDDGLDGSIGRDGDGERFGPGANGGSDQNSLTFGRDNRPHPLELQVPTPSTSSSSVNSVGNDGRPVRTVVTRSSEGTPGVDPSAGGVFTMEPVNDRGAVGDSMFRSSGNNPNMRNDRPASTRANSDTVEVLEGAYNKFNVKSDWASEEENPEVLNVGWSFEVETQSRFHNWVRPGADSGNRVRGGATPETRTTYGRCQAEFSDAGNFDLQSHLNDNTGANVRYTAPQNTSVGPGRDRSNNLALDFTRQVGER